MHLYPDSKILWFQGDCNPHPHLALLPHLSQPEDTLVSPVWQTGPLGIPAFIPVSELRHWWNHLSASSLAMAATWMLHITLPHSYWSRISGPGRMISHFQLTNCVGKGFKTRKENSLNSLRQNWGHPAKYKYPYRCAIKQMFMQTSETVNKISHFPEDVLFSNDFLGCWGVLGRVRGWDPGYAREQFY